MIFKFAVRMRLAPATTPNHSLDLDHDRDSKDFGEASQKHLDSVVATGASYKTDHSPRFSSREMCCASSW